MGDRDPQVQALLDKQAIHEVLALYLRGCDRADVSLVAAAYHDDGWEDHGGTFNGPATDWVASLRERLPQAGLMNHLMTNLVIELDGDRALSECYILTFSRVAAADPPFDSMTLTRAIDRFERRDGRWKIKHRTLVWESNRELPLTETWARGAIAADSSILRRGGKKPADALYTA
jgi:hypothetical protein